MPTPDTSRSHVDNYYSLPMHPHGFLEPANTILANLDLAETTLMSAQDEVGWQAIRFIRAARQQLLDNYRTQPISTQIPISDDLDNCPVHVWFSLSYAQYLTIPRSLLQAMPIAWQQRFVHCLEQLDETFDWLPTTGGSYWVRLKDAAGRFVSDPLRNYRHPNFTYIESVRTRPDPTAIG